MNPGEGIKEKIFFLTSYIGFLIFLFDIVTLVYIYPWVGDFYVYIPENVTIDLDPSYDWCVMKFNTIMDNNKTLWITAWKNEDLILQHRGKYVVITLAWCNSDDEYNYMRRIESIKEQSNPPYLGYYPKGIWYKGYYRRAPPSIWQWLGLLSIIPALLWIYKEGVKK